MLAIYCVATLLLGQPRTDGNVNIDRPGVDVPGSSADLLARRLMHQHDALTAVSLVYTQVSASREGDPQGDYLRRAISVSRAGMFRSDNSHGHDRLPWRLDLKRKTLVVTALGSTLLENLNRCIVDFADDGAVEAPAGVERECVFDVLCWWPFINWSPPQWYGHSYSMRAMLNEGSYRLLSEKETIGSKPCYTLIVNDILTVWCDCERPECVLKGERYDPKTKAIDSRFEMMGYEAVGSGIWLPTQFRIVRFDSDAHIPQLRERVVYDNTFLVSDIEVNEDVDMSVFRQEYAPGTVRLIGSPGETQYEPVVDGQLDHFNSILKWCRFGSFQTAPKRSSRWADGLLMFSFFFAVGCAVVVAISRAQSFRRIAGDKKTDPNGTDLSD